MYKRILVPVDGSPVSMNGLKEAIRIAEATGAQLRVLHVVDGIAFAHEHSVFVAGPEDYRQSGRKLVGHLKALVAKHPITANVVVVDNLKGRAADSIVGEAKKWRADLIVMGTHGRRGINRLVLGSDAEIVLRIAPVPVLLVRSSKSRAHVSAAARGARSSV